MREPKYRIWVKDERAMFYGLHATSSQHFTNSFRYRKHEVVLMQYTGLKDKNGTKIYEGDILKHHSLTEQMQKDLLHQIIGKIVIEKGMTYIVGKVSNGYIDEEIKTTNYKALLLSPELFEVIGNIYESPELLEVEEFGLIEDNFNLNFENHKKLCDEIHELYKLKNANYGNSFSELFEEFEMLYVVPRFVEKINRIKTLTMNKDLDYDDESIRDSLLDLANYSIMTVMELDKDTHKNKRRR